MNLGLARRSFWFSRSLLFDHQSVSWLTEEGLHASKIWDDFFVGYYYDLRTNWRMP